MNNKPPKDLDDLPLVLPQASITMGDFTGKPLVIPVSNSTPEIMWDTMALEDIVALTDYVNSRISKDPRYRNVTYFHSEGARACFLADWGKADNQIRVILKTDKKLNKSPRAVRHFQRGCDTANEVKGNTSIPEPELHHIIPIFDFFERTNGFGDIYVERFYSGFKNLDEMVSESGPLKPEEWASYALQLLDSVGHYISSGKYHRDHKPSNHLIKRVEKKVGGKLERRVDFWTTDGANMVSVNKTESKFMPTAGGHFVMDPLLMSTLTGKEIKYELGAELYEVGVSLLFAAMGGYGWEFDPDLRTARMTDLLDGRKKGFLEGIIDKSEDLWDRYVRRDALSSELGESSLTSDGLVIDEKRYNRVVRRTLRHLPSELKKFKPMFKKLLTLDEDKRYSSIAEFESDFKKLSEKTTFMDYLRKNAVPITTLLLIAGLAGTTIKNVLDKKDAELEFTQRYPVGAEWDGRELVLGNNIFNVDLFMYKTNDDMDMCYPDNQVFHVNSGDGVSGVISAHEIGRSRPDSRALPTFKGLAYFEGFPADSLKLMVEHVNRANYSDGNLMGGVMPCNFDLQVPNIPDGVYNLAIEFFAPDSVVGDDNAYVRFASPDKMIYRKTIPFVIGHPDKEILLSQAEISYSTNLEMITSDSSLVNSEGLEYEFCLPECGLSDTLRHRFSSQSYSHWISPNIPLEGFDKSLGFDFVTVARVRTLYDGKPIGQYFLPIRLEVLGSDTLNPIFWPELGIPGSEFNKELMKYNVFSDEYSR